MTVEEATNSNWAASAGFVGLGLGLTVGLVFGAWVILKVWKYVVRELREVAREGGVDDDGTA
jgi:hypothetical protein